MKQVLNRYEAAYKKRKSGRLKWVICTAKNEKQAAKSLDSYIDSEYRNKGYNRYLGPSLKKQTY